MVVTAAAVGMAYMLQHKGGQTAPPPVPVIVKQNPPNSPYPTNHASNTPLYGNFQEVPEYGQYMHQRGCLGWGFAPQFASML